MTLYIKSKFKTPIDLHPFVVATAKTVDAENIVAVNATGFLVQGTDATAAVVIGAATKGGLADDEVEVRMGLMAFENDTTTPVTAANIGEVGKVGADNTDVTISPAAGANLKIGRIKYIDDDGFVWIDTNDRD